jgi:hypothetical protein
MMSNLKIIKIVILILGLGFIYNSCCKDSTELKDNTELMETIMLNTTLIIDRWLHTGEYIRDSINETFSPIWKRDTIIRTEIIPYFFTEDSIGFNVNSSFFWDAEFGIHYPTVKFSRHQKFIWSESPTGYHSLGFELEYLHSGVIVGKGGENSQTRSVSWTLKAE